MNKNNTIVLFTICALTMGGCGSSSDSDSDDDEMQVEDEVQLQEVGSIDFEGRPDDMFSGAFDASPGPVALGLGVTATGLNGSLFYDFTTGDGWGLGGCLAQATSGTKLIGVFSGTQELRIDFPEPAALVQACISDGIAVAQIEAFNASDVSLGTANSPGGCPALTAVDCIMIEVDANDIEYVILSSTGTAPAMDDLKWSAYR